MVPHNIWSKAGMHYSPFLFLLVIDWVIKRATSENRGIQWGLTSFLEDLDFADDIRLLSHSQEHMMQQKTDRVTNEAASVGLKLNSKKTKIRICARNDKVVTVGRGNIEEV